MFSKTFIFLVGTIIGAYISQNYKIPNIKQALDKSYIAAQIVEKNLRKKQLETHEDEKEDEITKL